MSRRPSFATASLDDAPAVLGIAQVAAHLHGLAPGGLDQLGRLGGVLVLVEVGDEHVGALARERQRDRAADPAVAAGHDGGEALELAAAPVALLAVIGGRPQLGVAPRERLLLLAEWRRWALAGVSLLCLAHPGTTSLISALGSRRSSVPPPRRFKRAAHGVEQLLQGDRVGRREPFPVVVEVGVDVALARPLADGRRPLRELCLRVVAPPAARAVVEADEREVGRQLARLERADLGPVGDHERDVVRAQDLHHGLGEPAGVAELERVPERARQLVERVGEPLVVARELRRAAATAAGPSLPARASGSIRASSRSRCSPGLPQALDVRHVAAHLDREREALGRLLRPALDRLALRQPVERRVDLDRVEALRVRGEPAPRGQPSGIEDPVAPGRVVPARAPDADASLGRPGHALSSSTRSPAGDDLRGAPDF